MSAVLGIDAAWTATNPSGVALAVKGHSAWQLVALSPSYQCFIARADGRHNCVATGSWPDAKALLDSSARHLGHPVDLVAADIPLANGPITCRRTSDNAVSKAYGARLCGTHTPSAQRPGKISDDLKSGFARAGYRLQTNSISLPGLIEVYPHPALVEFARAPERIPYKASNIRKYWPTATATERRNRLLEEWAQIVELLEARIHGVKDALPTISLNSPASDLKSYEDMIDAVVCAAVAICAIEGSASPFGDTDSAIWIPTPIPVPINETEDNEH
jgi:predicted RNase H-like nuclease